MEEKEHDEDWEINTSPLNDKLICTENLHLLRRVDSMSPTFKREDFMFPGTQKRLWLKRPLPPCISRKQSMKKNRRGLRPPENTKKGNSPIQIYSWRNRGGGFQPPKPGSSIFQSGRIIEGSNFPNQESSVFQPGRIRGRHRL